MLTRLKTRESVPRDCFGADRQGRVAKDEEAVPGSNYSLIAAIIRRRNARPRDVLASSRRIRSE